MPKISIFEPIINTIKSIIEKYFVPVFIAIIIMGVLVFVVVVSTRNRKPNNLYWKQIFWLKLASVLDDSKCTQYSKVL